MVFNATARCLSWGSNGTVRDLNIAAWLPWQRPGRSNVNNGGRETEPHLEDNGSTARSGTITVSTPACCKAFPSSARQHSHVSPRFSGGGTPECQPDWKDHRQSGQAADGEATTQ